MKPYDPEAKCPKCGHDDIVSTYHRGTGYSCTKDEVCSGIYGEHQFRCCRSCQYEWLEAPLDDKGNTSKGT